jgi:Chalcone isomerase-like
VYSTGVYIDRSEIIGKVKAILSKSKTYRDLLHSKEFDDKVVESASDKTIVLQMARDVAAETMSNAISDSVKPRMKGKDKDALKKFSEILDNGLKDGGAKKGTQFRFQNCGNERLVVSINGSKKGSVASRTLCKAFTDVYLGHGGVSHTLKENVAKTVYSWK